MERLSPTFAVFNGHSNNADKRARQFLRDNGLSEWADEVDNVERVNNGIMAIFSTAPTAATGAYVALVTLFANEGC